MSIAWVTQCLSDCIKCYSCTCTDTSGATKIDSNCGRMAAALITALAIEQAGPQFLILKKLTTKWLWMRHGNDIFAVFCCCWCFVMERGGEGRLTIRGSMHEWSSSPRMADGWRMNEWQWVARVWEDGSLNELGPLLVCMVKVPRTRPIQAPNRPQFKRKNRPLQ
jgi:hypothetical protein